MVWKNVYISLVKWKCDLENEKSCNEAEIAKSMRGINQGSVIQSPIKLILGLRKF